MIVNLLYPLVCHSSLAPSLILIALFFSRHWVIHQENNKGCNWKIKHLHLVTHPAPENVLAHTEDTGWFDTWICQAMNRSTNAPEVVGALELLVLSVNQQTHATIHLSLKKNKNLLTKNLGKKDLSTSYIK